MFLCSFNGTPSQHGISGRYEPTNKNAIDVTELTVRFGFVDN